MSRTESNNPTKSIFERLQSGESVPFDDPQYSEIIKSVSRTTRLSEVLNSSTNDVKIRQKLGAIIGKKIDSSTVIFVPFHTNVGQFIKLGKNVFINHDCTFLDIGGITIEDDVLIGPKVSLITEDHPVKPADRKKLRVKPIHIKQNAWIGANATILPGVTVGRNSVVASGAVVLKDVPENTVVGGVPAKVIKKL